MDNILINTFQDYENLMMSHNINTNLNNIKYDFNNINYIYNLIGLNFLTLLFFITCMSTCLLKIYKDNKKIKYIAIESDNN